MARRVIERTISKTATPQIWLLSDNIMGPRGGGFRQQRWCEYFLMRGQSVRIFSLLGVNRISWRDVHSLQEIRELRRVWLADAAPQAGVRDTRWARVGRLIKHTLLVDLYYPSVLRLLLLTWCMLRTQGPKVAVLCSSPTFATAIIGRILKALSPNRVVMVLDMRDLWSLHTAFRGPKAHKRVLERWVIGGADIFTTVSIGLVDRFTRSFGAVPSVVYNVATQVSSDGAAAAEPIRWGALSPDLSEDTRKIVYTGSIPQGFYDLAGLLDGMEEFAAEAKNDSGKLQFVFVGASGELAALSAKRSFSRTFIVFLPQMSHFDVGKIQDSADALLFLGYRADDNQGQVSIKLFEYFRRKRPILPVHITQTSDVHRLVSIYCGCCPVLATASEVAQMLSAIANGTACLPVALNDVADRQLLDAYEETVTKVLHAVGRAS